jgi:hypothetical protein
MNINIKNIINIVKKESKIFIEEAKEHLVNKDNINDLIEKTKMIDKTKITNYLKNNDEEIENLKTTIIENLKKNKDIEFSKNFNNLLLKLNEEIENEILFNFVTENNFEDYFLIKDIIFSKHDIFILEKLYVTNDYSLLDNILLNTDDKINEVKNKIEDKSKKFKISKLSNNEILYIFDKIIKLSENKIEDNLKKSFKLSLIELSKEKEYKWFFFEIIYKLNKKTEEINFILEEYPIFDENIIDFFSNNEFVSKNNEFYKYREYFKDLVEEQNEKLFI